MPESITTLPPELIYKVFGCLEHIGTATSLSQTCRLMHDAWRAHRHVLSMALVPHHPVFWKHPERPSSDQATTSLWQHAKDYDNEIRGKFSSSVLLWASDLQISDKNEDGLVTAKRILNTARAIRIVARRASWQICKYSEERIKWFRDEEDWRLYSQYGMGRMLYKFITRFIDRQEHPFAAPNDDTMEIYGWWELACFVANHPELVPDGFPDLSGMLAPEDVTPLERHSYETDSFVYVVDAVQREYEELL
jgi:hypothetical protein